MPRPRRSGRREPKVPPLADGSPLVAAELLPAVVNIRRGRSRSTRPLSQVRSGASSVVARAAGLCALPHWVESCRCSVRICERSAGMERCELRFSSVGHCSGHSRLRPDLVREHGRSPGWNGSGGVVECAVFHPCARHWPVSRGAVPPCVCGAGTASPADLDLRRIVPSNHRLAGSAGLFSGAGHSVGVARSPGSGCGRGVGGCPAGRGSLCFGVGHSLGKRLTCVFGWLGYSVGHWC